MTFLHYVSLHLEEPNISGRLPLGREWSWLLLQLRDAESEVWMLLGSWSRAMYRGFHRFVPWATDYRDTHRVIGTLRTYISCPVKHAPSIYFCLRPRWDLWTSKNNYSALPQTKDCSEIYFCLRPRWDLWTSKNNYSALPQTKDCSEIYFCLRPRWDLWTSKNNYSAMPQTKDCSEILEAVCVSTFFQEYETYHSYLMKDCTSVRVEMR